MAPISNASDTKPDLFVIFVIIIFVYLAFRTVADVFVFKLVQALIRLEEAARRLDEEL